MATPHYTSLTVSFDPANGATSEGGNLQWKGWSVPTTAAEQAIGLKLIPDVDAVLASSNGTVVFHERGLFEVVKPQLKTIQFTEFIESLSDTCDVLFAVNKQGNPAPVTLTYDEVNKRFIPSEPFFGLVRIGQYTTGYSVVKYVPEKIFDLLTGVYVYHWGSVAAIYNNTMALWTIETPEGLSKGNEEFEVYRITSQVLVNSLGAWEYPLGWPDTPSYPGGATPVPKAKIGLVTERIHEIGMGDMTGRTWKRTKVVILNQPFANSPTYVPVRSVRSSSLPAGLSQDNVLIYQQFVADAQASIA